MPFSHPQPTAFPEAVFFDMDGTLIDSERLWDIAVEELSEHMGRRVDRETRERTLGASTETFFSVLSEYTGHAVDTPEELDRLKSILHARVAELFATELEWRPGARELLDALGAAGVPLALVTNTESALMAAPLEVIGESRFSAVITGDRVARSKPAPEPYLAAATALSVLPARAVAIEDSTTGATSAVGAGCMTLYVPSSPGQPDVPGVAARRDSLAGVDLGVLASLGGVEELRG
ncbi:HAD family hydrolase [Dietzia sp.]|uniref:HAD family hydrolase n=1 Tax=Dietzia sp. TaxID=1871616 RepID=UPI002FDA3391